MHRLKRRHEFSAVYQSGLRRSTPHLTLRALQHAGAAIPRAGSSEVYQGRSETQQATQIGISISQKVSKRAVVRNRIRRQIQAAFWELLPQVLSGWSLVVVVRPSATQCDYWQILQELKQLLMDAEVLDGH
nr:ribonuclease P protein component [Oculatella sp. LEGE 06141]